MAQPNWASSGENIISGIMGLSDDPYSGYRDYLNQIPGMASNMFNPFVQAGQNMLSPYSNLLKNLTANPTGFEDSVMSHYQMSPAAQYQNQMATQAANRVAAASGNFGTPAEQQDLAQRVQGIVSQDQGNYFNRAYMPFSQGMQGMQGLIGTGLNAANMYGNMMSNYYNDMGGLSTASDMSRMQSWGNLLGGAGDLASDFFGPKGK